MSTSPEQAISEQPAPRRTPERPRWQRRNLSPTRGLIVLAVFISLIAGTALSYDTVWSLLSHGVILILEVAEEAMDALLEIIGLAPGAAQMVTAYIGVLVGLGLFYFLLRKSMGWYRWLDDTLQDYRDMYAYLLSTWFRDIRADAIAWWHHLDWLAKTATVVFGLLVLVPLLLGISLGLGMLVAALI